MGLIRDALSTRKTMQKLPEMDAIHYITDDELLKLQDCFLGIIKDIDAVCNRNDICYMAAGGTCLGSVRHKGFIPWDDDVDLLMPREDLKKFIRVFEKELGDKYDFTSINCNYPIESMISAVYKKGTVKASVQTMNTDLPQGIHVDIFTIEAVPNNKIARTIKGLASMVVQYIAVSSLFYHFTDKQKKAFFEQTPAGRINYAIRYAVGKASSFASPDFWGRMFDKVVSYEKQSDLWAVPTDIGHYFGHIMPKEVYFPPTKGPFMDMEINLPHDTDKYLENQYGDYMTIPPVAGREKHWSIGFDLGE